MFLHPARSDRDLVADALPCLGTALRHTRATDPAARMIRVLLSDAESLVAQSGVLADNNAAIGLQKAHDAGRWTKLIWSRFTLTRTAYTSPALRGLGSRRAGDVQQTRRFQPR